MKLLKILLEQEKILVPRRTKDRPERHLRALKEKIQQYIKNGSKGSLNLQNTPITSLPDNLKYVGGDLNLEGTPIKSLPDNLEVKGSLELADTPITSLPDNLKVGRSLFLSRTPIKSLPSSLEVEGNLAIRDTPLDYNHDDIDIKEMAPNIKGKIYR